MDLMLLQRTSERDFLREPDVSSLMSMQSDGRTEAPMHRTRFEYRSNRAPAQTADLRASGFRSTAIARESSVLRGAAVRRSGMIIVATCCSLFLDRNDFRLLAVF